MVVKLQKPKFVFFGGRICPWEDAVFHISSEAVLRGLNVFEGLKGYWHPDGSFGIVELRRHYERLVRSAKVLHIPFETSLSDFEAATHALVKLLYARDQNMWIRATLYGDEGHWGENSTSNLVLTAYHTPDSPPPPIDTGVTAWQRGHDLALPYRVKTSTNYQVVRLVRIENRDRGYQEMIMLNQFGRVAEGLGSAVLMVRDGAVFTPPPWEGTLESITVDIVEKMCMEIGVPFFRRPIDRSELMIADELAFVGTLAEVTIIKSLDGQMLRPPTLLAMLSERYLALVTGQLNRPEVDFSIIPPNTPE